VLSITPSYASTKGGDTVTISGVKFDASTKVSFGGTASDTVSRSPTSSTQVVATVPKHDPGFVDVRVTTDAGTSDIHPAARFRYVDFTKAWTDTGNLLQGRYAHTATLLDGPACTRSPANCGKVLVAGGEGGEGQLKSAELFDPAGTDGAGKSGFGAWTPTGSMAAVRAGHTATLLADGRVLATCGDQPPASSTSPFTDGVTGVPGSAEIYDPASGKWSITGSMATYRYGCTATRLPNGKVMVTGGLDSSGSAPTGSTEVYDPVSGKWSTTGSMATPRHGHTASLLPGGSVLVSGGTDANGQGLRSAEVYDPYQRNWRPTGSMVEARGELTATPLPDHGGAVLVAGGSVNSELYDPAADNGRGAWTPTGKLPEGLGAPTSTLLSNGNVLMVGSGPANNQSAALFEAATGSWRPETSPNSHHWLHTATTLINGQVLVTGSADSAAAASAELYSAPKPPEIPIVTGIEGHVGPDSGGARVKITGTHLFPTVSVFFGQRQAKVEGTSLTALTVVAPPAPAGVVDVTVTTTVGTSQGSPADEYTYATGSWSTTGQPSACKPSPPCAPRYLHTATRLADGRVLMAGGTNDWYGTYDGTDGKDHSDAALASAETYDPAAGSWTATGSLIEGRWDHTATLLSGPHCGGQCGKVLVVGGEDAKFRGLTSVELYDPATGTWTSNPTGQLHFARFSHTATLLPDGRVLVTGGDWVVEGSAYGTAGGRGDGLGTAEIYDPSTSMWSLAASMPSRRTNHTATVLPNGTVLVAGGFGGNPGVHRAAPTLASADVYDPASNAWRSTGPMAINRYGHTATLLSGPSCNRAPAAKPCGQVLVAGGNNAGPDGTSSAELYDPTANRGVGAWSATGGLHEARGGHTANLLADGTVLVAGSGPVWPGNDLTPGPFASAEIYDPATGRWRYTSFMADRRGAHTATLLADGRVLAAGGYKGYEVNPSELADSAELYLPAPVPPIPPACELPSDLVEIAADDPLTAEEERRSLPG